MAPWDPAREELAAIWRVLSTLVQDVARLVERVDGLERGRMDVDD